MRWNTVIPAGLLSVVVLVAGTGCGGSSQWVSRATFSVRDGAGSGAKSDGPFTAADSTVPAGPSGNAEIQGSTGGQNGTSDYPYAAGHFPYAAATYLRLPRFLCPESTYFSRRNVGEVVVMQGKSPATEGK